MGHKFMGLNNPGTLDLGKGRHLHLACMRLFPKRRLWGTIRVRVRVRDTVRVKVSVRVSSRAPGRSPLLGDAVAELALERFLQAPSEHGGSLSLHRVDLETPYGVAGLYIYL